MVRSREYVFAILGLIAVSGCNCGAKQKIQTVTVPSVVVPGSPSVNPDLPQIDQAVPPPPVQWQINVPRQCDIFTQNTVRKTDILWVIQNSGSMAPHQAQLAYNFQAFISYLLSADPPIDFHIGVTTTDTDSTNSARPTQGRLSGWSNGNGSGSFIACDQNHLCNTAPAGTDPTQSVEDAFTSMSAVGTQGSSHQRGLYASYLALNRPENIDNGNGQGFIRSDAALYIVYVGSEDDLSCSPTLGQSGAAAGCRTVDPECACADDTQLDWGSTDFFVRFLQNYKGYGHSDLVASAAVVATQHNGVVPGPNDPYQSEVGCEQPAPDGGVPLSALWGKRYVDVANATGGASTSICSSDFNDALSRLGFAVSGLRRDFRLSRGPITSSIEVFESKRPCQSGETDYSKCAPTCTADTDCTAVPNGYTSCAAGHCSKPVPSSLQPSATGAQYIQCENGVLRNIEEFGTDPSVIPPALGTVEICYDVDAHFSNVCQ